jgi:NitT/TauT family transport system substrate-binding protein
MTALPLPFVAYYTGAMTIDGMAMAFTRIVSAAGVLLAASAATAQTLDKVSFGTNWVAQGEHGGFYQALVDGTYRRYGLDVTIVPGGPNVNNRILLPVGKIDFFMSANTLQSFDAVAQNIPTAPVAAIFQKEPQVLLAHPDQGIDRFEDLKRLTLFVSREGVATYFQWLKADYGFDEAKVKPYTFNPQPFLADRRSAMQGYVTSEPYVIERQAGFRPKAFLLADHGFDAYSTLIETRRALVENKPDLVQRFVDASIIGWYNYLYGDNRAAIDRIRKDNPEMTEGLIRYSIATMKQYGIVDSGDAVSLGIGAMTDARMKSFYDKMVRAGVVNRSVDLARSYTLRFVNRKIGLARRRRQDLFQRRCRARAALARRVAGRVRVAARPLGLRQIDGAAHHRRPERADRRRGRLVIAIGSRGRHAPDRLRIPGADPDALGERFRQRPSAADPAGNGPDRGAAARRGHAGAGRARRLCRRLSARTVRRHAHARLDRAGARHPAGSFADGRAVRGARRNHPLSAQ